MTLEEEKRFVTLRNALWGIGVLVVVGLIAGAFLFHRAENAIDVVSSQLKEVEKQVIQVEKSLNVFASGDTPVVLIGGSVDLQASSKTNWQPDTTVPGGYYASGEGSIGAISIRNPGDGELTRVMTSGQSWVVTVVSDQANSITVNQATSDPIIHVTPLSGTLTLPTTMPKKLHYHKRGMVCPGGRDDCDTLQTISITVNNVPLGVFSCTDAAPTPSHPSGNPGHCRVAFIEK
jgi:hypothetical protein